MAVQSFARDPRHHTQKTLRRQREITDHLWQDIAQIDEPQLNAVFEAAAAVLRGIKMAFSYYEQKNELAWEERVKACIVLRRHPVLGQVARRRAQEFFVVHRRERTLIQLKG